VLELAGVADAAVGGVACDGVIEGGEGLNRRAQRARRKREGRGRFEQKETKGAKGGRRVSGKNESGFGMRFVGIV